MTYRRTERQGKGWDEPVNKITGYLADTRQFCITITIKLITQINSEPLLPARYQECDNPDTRMRKCRSARARGERRRRCGRFLVNFLFCGGGPRFIILPESLQIVVVSLPCGASEKRKVLTLKIPKDIFSLIVICVCCDVVLPSF